MNNNKTPVLIIGSHIAAYGAIRSLGPLGIPIYLAAPDTSTFISRSRYVSKSFELSSRGDDFIAECFRLGKKIGEKVVVMIAGDDRALRKMSQHYAELPDNFLCTFRDWEVTRFIQEKQLTYQKCEEIGVWYPQTIHVGSEQQLDAVLSSFTIPFPVILKANDSGRFYKEFDLKGILANSAEEIRRHYRDYQEFYGSLIISEYIVGDERNLYCLKVSLAETSEPTAVFVDKKVRTSGKFEACVLTASTWSDEVVEMGTRLLKAIGQVGYASVEFKYDAADDRFKLMEINGRVSLNCSHATRCGINLPLEMYKTAVGAGSAVIEAPVQTYPDRIMWWMPLNDVLVSTRAIFKRERGLVETVKETLGKGYILEPYSWRDPLVGLRFTIQAIAQLIKKNVRGRREV